MKTQKEKTDPNSRRDFVKKSAVAVAAFSIVPRHVLGKGFNAPSDTLYIATVGAGGKGTSDTSGFVVKYDSEKQAFVPNPKAKIAFLCDVDQVRGERTFALFPDAKRYVDWREMMEKEHQNFDAVSVSTPDHTHAIAASAAITLGKHIWVQKPMTHDIYEARVLAKLAREHKVVSQMGNQGSSNNGVREMREWYEAGLIGDVTDVYCYTDRPGWPQGGINWPTKVETPPSTLNWDLWQGTAPNKPYPGPVNDRGARVLPGNWRGWWDYGTGAIGDMGAHILEAPMTVLNLGYVTEVQSSVGKPGGGMNSENFLETCPPSSYTTLTFPNPKPGKGKPENIRVHWMDGGLMPPRPKEMDPTDRLDLADGSGMLFVGTKGKMIAGCYSTGAKLLPVTRMEESAVKKLPVKYPRVPGGSSAHYQQWVDACIAGFGKMQTSSPFDKAAMVVENMLVANLAIRGFNVERVPNTTVASVIPTSPATGSTPAAARPRVAPKVFPARNVTLLWDHAQMKITNVDEVNQFVRREYREGWHLSGV